MLYDFPVKFVRAPPEFGRRFYPGSFNIKRNFYSYEYKQAFDAVFAVAVFAKSMIAIDLWIR